MNFFDALAHSFTTISTGFSTMINLSLILQHFNIIYGNYFYDNRKSAFSSNSANALVMLANKRPCGNFIFINIICINFYNLFIC